MSETPANSPFILWFAPESWTATELCSRFVGLAMAPDRTLAKGAWSAQHHLDKHEILAGLMVALRPTLSEDGRELQSTGFSSARWSRIYAALIETLFCELYACLDGMKRALHGAYPGVSGIPEKSTQKLFRHAHEGTIGTGFPEALRALLSAAQQEWFPRLASIRTELQHGLTGSCFRNPKTDKVQYSHLTLPGASPRQCFVIEDVEEEADRLSKAVRALADRVFEYLFAALQFQEHRVICGVFHGRCYERRVVPGARLTRHSGRCYSRRWFEGDASQRCPLADDCGAYRRSSDASTGSLPEDSADGV